MLPVTLKPVEPKPYEWADRCCLYVEEPPVGLLHGKVFSRPRIEWAPGPWEDEPDLVEWTHRGYKLLMLRNHCGSLCGYIGLPPEHPLHGMHYDDAEDLAAVQTHRGLTYSGQLPPEMSAPETWWLGFDCAHAFDAMPAMDALFNTPKMRETMGEMGMARDPYRHSVPENYRTVEYVRFVCEDMAEQACRVSKIKFPGATEKTEP